LHAISPSFSSSFAFHLSLVLPVPFAHAFRIFGYLFPVDLSLTQQTSTGYHR
jgi:hypothetical protein